MINGTWFIITGTSKIRLTVNTKVSDEDKFGSPLSVAVTVIFTVP